MQILFEESEEKRRHVLPWPCPGPCEEACPAADAPLPHMGWNRLSIKAKEHPLLRGIEDGTYMYFVHSFAAPVLDVTLASCDYEQKFTALCGAKNFYGCQFHPERSGESGARILKNFMEL
jgi:glutamine amidotransferase